MTRLSIDIPSMRKKYVTCTSEYIYKYLSQIIAHVSKENQGLVTKRLYKKAESQQKTT